MSAAAWSCGQALLVHMSMRRAGLSIARIRHGFRLGCFVTAVVGCSGGSGGPAACICSAGIKSDTPSPQRASGRRQRRRTLGAGWVALVLLRNHRPQGVAAHCAIMGLCIFFPLKALEQGGTLGGGALPPVLSFLGCKAALVPLSFPSPLVTRGQVLKKAVKSTAYLFPVPF